MYSWRDNRCHGKGIVDLNSGDLNKARIFLLLDLQDFFSDLGSEGRKIKIKKALKMTS